LSLTKEPIENVSISIEGSILRPVITNENGEFSLNLLSGEEWIMISPTGNYKTKRIFLNNRTRLTIYLTPEDLKSGNDKIRVLSQDMNRRDIIGAFTDLNSANIQHEAVMSVDQLMSGQIPGMLATNRSGMPGSGAAFTLRGINSIYANTQPLIVIDGIPMVSGGLFESNLSGYQYNPFMEINIFDISNTIVVKDPSITAGYGSKASNGIIFIQTLDPSATQTVIEADYRNGLSLAPARQIPQLSSGQHRTLMSELLFTSNFLEEEIIEEFPNLFLTEDDERFIDYGHETNWQDYIFTNSLYTNFNLNVKGGDGIARYGLSVGYTDGDGIIKNSNYNGVNLRFVSLLNIFTWLKMDAMVSLNYNNSELKEAASVSETSPIFSSLAKSPMLSPYQYDLEGSLLTTLSDVDELGISNPVATIENFEAKNKNYNFNITLGLTGEITKDLQLKSNFSLLYNVLKESIYMPNRGMELYYNDEAINVSKATNNSINTFYNNTYLSYNKTLGDNHHLISNTGVHLQTNRFQLDWALGKNAHENDEYRSLQDGQNDLREIGGNNRNWNWLSFYETVNYTYKDKYLATASVSMDGSSRVGDYASNTIGIGNVPFGLFYSGGVAWRISSESFLKNSSWIEELKLRVSAGRSGNDDIGEASATNYYEAIKFRETVGLYPATVPNEELSYETVTQINTGIDFSAIGNRFSATIDYFISTTEDMIIFSPLEPYFGYDLRVENGGKMKNNGLEVAAYFRMLDKGNFKWDIRATASSINNQITEIEGEFSYPIIGGEKINMVGESANSFYGYVFQGVFSTQNEANEAALVNDRGIPFQSGDAIYEDRSGPEGDPDNVIDDYDKTVIGSALPEFFGGLSNRFSYKRFALDVALQFVSGNEIFNYVRFKNENISSLSNQSASVLNRWQYDGHITDIPRAYWDDPAGNSAFSSRWIEDGSFARLKNITLSYTIPEKFLAFRNAEFYVSVSNLLTLTNYLGYDPEFAFSHSQLHRGIDYGQMPQTRQFIAGIKIGL
jgi:TonB-linked SusC/RagA family outer membrane protein